MTEKVYIGIDPGKSGAIAILYSDKTEVYPYSDDILREKLVSISVENGENCLCFVEQVGAMPKQGVTSMFNFGKSFGYILGVLEAYGVPYQTVASQKWKKHYSLGNDKAASVQVAKRLFPGISLLPTNRCRKENDGMAEALLIALYGKRTDGNK